MSSSEDNSARKDLERELRIQRQIAFAAGVFQEDITIRTLLESIAEGVVIIDNSGTILLVNARAEAMFGYDKRELIGLHHSVLIPEGLRKVHEEHQAQYFASPVCRPMGQLLELVGLRKDGTPFPVEISLGAIQTINGLLVLALIDDITLRKKAEQKLRESEELFRIQVGCLDDYAVFMLDPHGNIMSWNAGAQKVKGYRAEEIIGRHFSCLYPEEARNSGEPEELLRRAYAEGRVETQGWRVRKDGSLFWADVVMTAVRTDNGEIRGYSKVTRDITERKQAEDALRFSEARYRALFSDNPTMIVTVDADLTMLTVNPACSNQLGYPEEELAGHSVLKLFHEADRAGVAEKVAMCLENPNQVYHWKFRKVTKDGDQLWVEETAQAMYDLNHQPTVLIVCQDVTAREQLLLQLEAVLESINEAVIICDLQENIITMNKAALVQHGYDSADQVRRPLRDLQEEFEFLDMSGAVIPFEEWPLVKAIRGERFYDYEVQFHRKDNGKRVIQSVSGGPVHEKNDGAILAVSTSRDITGRKEMEAELQQAKELLEHRVEERTAELTATVDRLQAETRQRLQAMEELRDKEQMLIHQGRMAAMGEMIGFIAHQWRQPLNTLGLVVQELPIYFKSGEMTQEYLESRAAKARELIGHMSRTIDDFRNFFRSEKQKVPFKINDLLEQTLNLVMATLREKQTELKVSVECDAEVEGYPNEYCQVILNILVNINDAFADRQVAQPRIEIRIFCDHGKTVMTIADNAGGIAEEIIDKVFDAYFTTKGADKGTGLGLYMAKTIIEKNMGGKLTVRNTGEGAEFRIEV